MKEEFISWADFEARLREFTAEDFYGDGTNLFSLPFQFLIRESVIDAPYYSVSRYDQYAAILAKVAAEKGCDMDDMHRRIREGHNHAIYQGDYTNRIANFIQIVAGDLEPDYMSPEAYRKYLQKNKNKVTVLPLMCGAGKTTAISYLIRRIIDRNDGRGILIVTDRVERMKDYIEPDFKRDPTLRRYLDSHKKDITILKSGDNYFAAKNKANRTPVLIMTTQRYFQRTPEEIKEFLKWGKNGCNTRPLILFDEVVPLKEVVSVTRRQYNDVATLLCEGILHTKEWEEKQWCVDQWEAVRRKVYDHIKESEAENELSDFYTHFCFPDGALTEDDLKFSTFVLNHIDTIEKYARKNDMDIKPWETMDLIHTLMTEGCLYHCSKQGNWYQNTFSTIKNNSNKVLDIGAKVIIMDGTGKIFPDYKQEFVYIEEDRKYNRRLDNLTIHFVHGLNTNKSAFDEENGEAMLHLAAQYIQSRHPNEAIAAFTHQNAAEDANKYFDIVEYFGNIKGSNDFRTYTYFAQIGINRFPENYYLTYFFCQKPERYNRIRGLSPEAAHKELGKIKFESEYQELKNDFLLTDLEQNMFRGAIRNPSFIDPMHYYVFCNTQTEASLIKRVRDRYAQAGACIKEHDEADLFKAQIIQEKPLKKLSFKKRIIEWTKTVGHNEIFSVKEKESSGTYRMMLQELNLTVTQYETVRRKNPDLQDYFSKNFITEGLGLGHYKWK